MSGTQQVTVATQIEQQRLRSNAISLTEWTSTDPAQIAAGSKVEVGGSLYYFSSDDTIEDWAVIPNLSVGYIRLVPSGTTITAYWGSAAPTFSDSKQGWYASAASNQRVVGGVYKSGANSYEDKWLYSGRNKKDASWITEGASLSIGISFKGSADIDRRIEFSETSDILWDQSEDEFNLNKPLNINTGGINAGTANIAFKVIDIGDWDMDGDANVNVAHGLDETKMRSVDVVIRNDNGVLTYPLDGAFAAADAVAGYYIWGSVNVTLNRRGSGWFDATTFDATSYNRGWITIIYEV